MSLHSEIHSTLETIDQHQWNELNPENNPFVKYEFLVALERNGCLGKRMGWFPRYFVIKDEQQSLVAAAMCYIKHNSHGEFVFDWAWADAYHRTGRMYYPKLVCAAPFTPVQGPRLMVHPALDEERLGGQLIKTIIKYCEDQHLSSFHCLFPRQSQRNTLVNKQLMLRKDYQFHWHNHGYDHFEDFLSEFKSRKRKKTRRERETVLEQSINFQVLHGDQLSDEQWKKAHHFYQLTFKEKGNTPALTLDFFREIAQTMGEQIVVIFAIKDSVPIACAINFKDDTSLYGRYWGCDFEYNCLHFETCFYQGIEYCIKHGLQRFEPGAQGEHKITRGFLPTETYSAHWIADKQFKRPIEDFLNREGLVMDDYEEDLWEKSPFRDGLHRDELSSSK